MKVYKLRHEYFYATFIKCESKKVTIMDEDGKLQFIPEDLFYALFELYEDTEKMTIENKELLAWILIVAFVMFMWG